MLKQIFVASLAMLLAPEALAGCMTVDSIAKLDAAFDSALVANDVKSLERLLHPQFVWVHSKASLIQKSREELVGPIRDRVKAGLPADSVSRTQSDVSVVIAGNTAVAYGFTNIVRTDDFAKRTGSPKLIRYHFMRTYAEQNETCVLVSNHTQEVWREGQPDPK